MVGGVVVGVAVTALVSSNLAVGGPLDPPLGPIADTSPSLADIESSIAGSAGAFGGAEFLDTSMVPGSARDGKPLPLAGNRDNYIDVEIEGVVTPIEFAVIDIAQSIEIIEFISGDDQLPTNIRPGNVRNEISLLRTLPQQDTALFEWYQDHYFAGGNPNRNVVIRLRDQSLTEVAVYNCFDCLISGLDVRSIDGQVVEQLVIECESIQSGSF